MKIPTHRLGFLLVLLAMGGVVGCGDAVGELKGTVQYKNKSVATGTVTAFDSKGRPHQGPIQQGEYRITGIPLGEVTCIVLSADPGKGPELPKGRPGEKGGLGRGKPPKDGATAASPVSGWFAIPKKYAEQATSDLKTEVKAATTTYNIELKD